MKQSSTSTSSEFDHHRHLTYRIPIPVQHTSTITTKASQQRTIAFKLILPLHFMIALNTTRSFTNTPISLSQYLTPTIMPPIPWWVHSSAQFKHTSIFPRTHLTTFPPPTNHYNHGLETFLEVLIVIFCILSLSYSIYLAVCFVAWILRLMGYELQPCPFWQAQLSLRERYSSREHVTRHGQRGTYSDDVEAVEMPRWAKVTNRTGRSWT